jgi:hypothetical protein
MASLQSQRIFLDIHWTSEHDLGFNFIVEILLILIYDVRSVDQTMNDTPFLRDVGGCIWNANKTNMSRLPAHFRGQFWSRLHNQTFQKWKGSISLNFRSEFDGRPNSVDLVKKLL